MAPVLIFGAGGGVGSVLARTLLSRGQSVFLTARNPAYLEPFQVETGVTGIHVCDALDTDSIKAAVTAADTGEGLAGLAYCIGSIVLKPLKSASLEDFLNAFQLNALGAAIAVQAGAESLKKASGSVVLFSSIAVGQGFSNHTVISAAKGAVEGLTRALAAELAPSVRVNAIAPSLTGSKMAARLTQNPQMAAAIAALHPIPRLGVPEDSANLAAFLLSPESGWITGQILHVDGGRSSLRVKG